MPQDDEPGRVLPKLDHDVQHASLDPIPEFGDALELPVAVNVLDPGDETVMRAEITMHVSEKAPPE